MCGIFGQVSKKKVRFDYTSFCTLGIHNDVRGGDSCGVFIDGKVEYGVDKRKLFEDFLIDSDLVQNTKSINIAFGHCRKASVGAIKESTAQPVVLKNDNGDIDFVVMHNGTIYNYEDLAKKYIPEIDILGMTDSQVMARIFYYKGYDVLSEYNGGAVFAIADYRGESPEILFWRGESPNSLGGVPIEERPLYLAIDDNDLIFSSIYTFLPVLRRRADIVQLNANVLCKYNGVDLEVVKEYSRAGQYQYDRTYYNNYSYGNYNYSYGTNNSCNVSHIYSSTKDGKCYTQGKVVHGKVLCDLFGDSVKTAVEGYEMWFWNGILLKNKDCFNYLSTLAQEFGCTPQDLEDVYTELPLFLSPYPYLRTKEGEIEIVDSPISSKPFTGSFFFPFSPNEITVHSGKHVSQRVVTIYKGMGAYLAKRNDEVPYKTLCNNFGILTNESN